MDLRNRPISCMTGEEKREVLRAARGLVLEIDALKREAEEIESWAEAHPPVRKEVASFGNKRVDKVQEAAIKLMSIRAKIREDIGALAQALGAALDIIAAAPEAMDRAILTEHYINGLTWEDVGEKVGYEERQCRRRASIAIGVPEGSECP